MLRFIPRDSRALTGREAAALRPYEGVTARLLYSRGMTNAQEAHAFLNPSLDQLHDPMLMHGMKEAVSILAKKDEKEEAIEKKNKEARAKRKKKNDFDDDDDFDDED